MTTQTKPIELYSLPTPNGQKAAIMLEELGVPYTYHRIDIGKGDQFKPEFLAISPNNKIPAIIDPEGPGGEPISIFESGAILKYLGLKFGQFYPQDMRAQVKVDEWLFWQVGGFGPMLGQNHHFALYAPERIPYATKRYVDETHRLYGVLNKQLEGQDYIAGEYSIADIACIGWAQLWERQGMDINEFPNVKAWIERCNARPAVKRGLEVGKDLPSADLSNDKAAQAMLFNQRAR
ncbi:MULTISPECIES: glutathione S-transferase N-terminal domain-containing protein [unclassified Devosia]|jgi:GST-like protein|uniref:glutathione S-transferase N-terminal domain-containing protein n=1 Tax=unclassified Devosia TaxID=196773 RepID=UPI0015572B05|nr:MULTISPECIES: glutathione S-transferase N-terminal domain-containing protein [unclassified Devosia]MDF2797260.1 glutathione S-transferase family protein [Devosia sp.]